MTNADPGPIYAKIGEHLLSLCDASDRPIYLYAEAEAASMYAAVFLDRDLDVLYIDPDSKLFDILSVAWEEEEPDKRWTAMDYVLRHGEFTASFRHTPFADFDPNRRYVGLRRNLGDKPVSYPLQDDGYDDLDPAHFPSAF